MDTANLPANDRIVNTGIKKKGISCANRLARLEYKRAIEEEVFSQTLLHLALVAGEHRGLAHEESQDCGIGFVLHMLADPALPARVRAGKTIPTAWLWTCANHWAANFVRHRRRLYARECLTADISEATHQLNHASLHSQTVGQPEARLLRRELMQRLLTVTLSLSDNQRTLFAQRYLNENSIEEIARQTRRTPGAIKQALASLRRCLRTQMSVNGLNKEEIAEYLHLFAYTRCENLSREPSGWEDEAV